MMSVGKKLSIAFYWHMHQPVYQLTPDGDFLMPWVRLHAVKDYLDMLLIMNNFKNLKLNFNLVPVLLNALINYGENGYHDIHSRLSIKDVSELTDDDREFILNNFFDANYHSMIAVHEGYNKLYQKRFADEIVDIENFSPQEYSDIMAWFNLAWIDPVYKDAYPELRKLLNKGQNYTLEDRIEIINFHRKIIKQIIPAYKKFWKKGRIEITTSPYFHPILPILMDCKGTQKDFHSEAPSFSGFNMADDAKFQIKSALDRVEEIFGKRPKGMWPSEQCVGPCVLELMKELGVEWTISDEGVLTNSINFDFVRDFKGYLEDPYFLMKSYEYKTKNNFINVIFRDSVIPNLISFEYPNHDPKTAAMDLYDRIKVIQNKISKSPDVHHILTIAMDGENSWENYANDGGAFLDAIYSLIEKDESLETVLVSEYLKSVMHHKPLKKVQAGSWINRSFQLWIGDPVKNLAWSYLKQVKDDFKALSETCPEKNVSQAYKEILIAQGSDWFWWYGEPNDSGQDHVFDYLFREHLKNVYRYLEVEPPDFLNTPLISSVTKPSRYPKKQITPQITGVESSDEVEWLNAGCIDMPDGPVLKENKLFDKICYGADEDNFYLRLYLNDYYLNNPSGQQYVIFHQLYIYLRNADRKQSQAPIRLINKTENIFPLMREKFHNELKISMLDDKLYPAQLIKAMQGSLWALQSSKDIKVAFEKVIDIKVPFDILDIAKGERLEFFFANANFGIKDSFIPQDVLLNVQRP